MVNPRGSGEEHALLIQIKAFYLSTRAHQKSLAALREEVGILEVNLQQYHQPHVLFTIYFHQL